MISSTYNLILFYDGSEHRTYTTTDKERARKVYQKFNLKYGYAPRVWVDGVRLRIYQADELFKTNNNDRKARFARAVTA